MNRRVASGLTHVLVSSLLFAALVPGAMTQANVQGRWSTMSSTMSINPVHVALLSNGKILVVAGSGNCPPSQSGCPSGPPYGSSNGSGALLLDPVSGQTIAQFSLPWDMFCNGMVLLQDGRALIDGGTIQYDPFHGQPQVAIFDPATNTFSNTQNMADGRWYPTVLTLGDGRVMAFSGLGKTGGTNNSVEFYTVGSGWSTQSIASWTPDLYPRLHLLPDGTVLYSGAGTTSKLFDPSTQIWNTNVAHTNYSGTRTYGTSILLPLTPANNYDPKVIILGGGSPATKTTEIIDLGAATPKWVSGLNMSQARIEMNAVILPDGIVLALGGSVNDEDTGSLSLNADLFDLSTVDLSSSPPNLGAVSSAGANATQRLYHSVALLLPDATVWLAGGNPSRGTYNNTMEIYQPAYLFNPNGTMATRPSITSAPASISYNNTFSVTTPDAANIASAVLVRNGTVTHAFGTDQREVGLSFTAGSGTLTVTAPPNGNIAPPGYYMLFILNSSGVPSLASFVQLGSQLAPPTNLAATVGSGQVNLSWSASNGASSYNVKRSITSGGPYTTIASPTTTSYTDTGVTNGTTYYYVVTAVNAAGESTNSNQVSTILTGPSDFSLSAAPSSQTAAPRSGKSYTVSVTPSNGFTGGVTFKVTGLPPGGTANFSPSSVSGSGSSTMTLRASSATPVGSYPITITAKSGTLNHSTQVTLVVADFSISVTPSSQTVSRGSNTAYTVTITPLGAFSASVSFRVSGLPLHTSASFNPTSVLGSGTSTLTISVRNTAGPGTYSPTITAKGGGATHSANVSLVIQ